MAKHVLSFVIAADGGMVTIHADANGLSLLIDRLSLLRNLVIQGDCPHTHLHAMGVPLDELTTSKLANQPAEKEVVQHVKIYGWTDEWAVRHGFRASMNSSL